MHQRSKEQPAYPSKDTDPFQERDEKELRKFFMALSYQTQDIMINRILVLKDTLIHLQGSDNDMAMMDGSLQGRNSQGTVETQKTEKSAPF